MAKYMSQEWRDNISRSKMSHGHRSRGSTKAYRAWIAMRRRCEDPKCGSYINYGARGVYVCYKWKESFERFYRDMGDPPTALHSLGRIDNEMGYAPGNCEWQTAKQQLRNTRANRTMTAFGERKTLIEWAEDERCKSNYHAIWRRLSMGWSAERAISNPVRKMKNNHIKKEA